MIAKTAITVAAILVACGLVELLCGQWVLAGMFAVTSALLSSLKWERV